MSWTGLSLLLALVLFAIIYGILKEDDDE